MTMSASLDRSLKQFDRLSNTTSLYNPAEGKPDRLVLFFSWMGAANRPISKYTSVYQEKYPNAQIILVRHSPTDYFSTTSSLRKSMQPAVEVAHQFCEANKSHKARILVQSFSNGGAKMLWIFSAMFKEKTGMPVPAQVIALDSSPGTVTMSGDAYWRGYKAFEYSFPKSLFWKIVGPILLHTFIILYAVYHEIARRPNSVMVSRAKLFDEKLFNKHAKRVYLFSKADEVVRSVDVEAHADEAEVRGMQVQKVVFERSPHAGHILEDANRYWTAIASAWDGDK
jgi:hypothetical protein